MSMKDKIDKLIADYINDNPLCEPTCIILDAYSYQILKTEVYETDDCIELELLDYQGLKIGSNFFTHTVIHVG